MRVRVTFETELPELPEVSEDDLEAWLKYSLGANGGILNSNPLIRYGIEADMFSIDYEVLDG